MSALPLHTHRDQLDALAASTKSGSRLALLGRRPFLRWFAVIGAVMTAVWLLSPSEWTPSSLSEKLGKAVGKGSLGIGKGAGLGNGGQQVPAGDGVAEAGEGEGEGKGKGTTTTKTTAETWAVRKRKVSNSAIRSWTGYMNQAFPQDELLPMSGKASSKLNGWSVTLVDSLSTLWLMGLKKEFYDGVQAIERQKFNQSVTHSIPFFETVIRYLGGYLSAYALSKEPILLSLADDLGRTLLPAFSTDSGLPAAQVVPVTNQLIHGSGLLAELGSCQVEYKYLAKLTGRPEYYERAEAVMTILYNATTYNNLFTENWNVQNGLPLNEHYTIGANTDSTYEYFLKQYLQAGDKKALRQYLKSMEGVISNLLYVSPNRGLLYVTDLWTNSEGKYPSNNHEHLACFLGGMLALGAERIPIIWKAEAEAAAKAKAEAGEVQEDEYDISPPPKPKEETLEDIFPEKMRQRHKWAAEGLAYTCYVLYADQLTGLSSDGTTFTAGEKWVDTLEKWEKGVEGKSKPPGTRTPPPEKDAIKRDYMNRDSRWLMRPETVESLYIHYKTTGDPVWRERGWEIYQAIEKYAKTPYGYGSVVHVDLEQPEILEEMPSYFLAETLKYLYLLFDDQDPIDLSKWVFNTEAHPLPVFRWTEREKERFKVAY